MFQLNYTSTINLSSEITRGMKRCWHDDSSTRGLAFIENVTTEHLSLWWHE